MVQVICLVSKFGAGALVANFDVEAYLNVPVHLSHPYLVGVKWHNQFQVDLLLPFGLWSALFIFNTIEDMVEWILVTSYKIPDLLHYLDDFITECSPHSHHSVQLTSWLPCKFVNG